MVNLDPISQPLEFRNLTVKSRLFRSSISGRCGRGVIRVCGMVLPLVEAVKAVKAVKAAKAVTVVTALASLGPVACAHDCEPPPADVGPRSDLDDGVPYLSALREAADGDGASVRHLADERRSYADWKRVRMAEIEEQPYFRARPEEAD
jgi:hypothetical protein